MQFSRSTEARAAQDVRRRSLKTEQRGGDRDAVSLEPGRRFRKRRPANAGRRDSLAGRAGARQACELPRKEVIQPQLPLRLPCYDFTPITSPTFDGSLPCGLGHRLRVLPAFVV